MDRPCNSQNVRITDCFIRSDDDCVVLKGLDLDGPNDNVENIVVENSVLWCDRAWIFLLGHESRAAYMRSITLRNLDVIHFTMTPFLLEPGEDMRLEGAPGEYLVQIEGADAMHDVRDARFENVSILVSPLTRQSPQVRVGPHAQDIRFGSQTQSAR